MKLQRHDACDRNSMTVVRYGFSNDTKITRHNHLMNSTTSWQKLLENAERIPSMDRGKSHRGFSRRLVDTKSTCNLQGSDEQKKFHDECSTRERGPKQSLFSSSAFSLVDQLQMKQSEITPQNSGVQPRDCLQQMATYVWVWCLDMFFWTVSNVFWLVEYIILRAMIACKSTTATYMKGCVARLLERIGAKIAKVIVCIDRWTNGRHDEPIIDQTISNDSNRDHQVGCQKEALEYVSNPGCRRSGNNLLTKKRYEDMDDISNNIHLKNRLFTRFWRRSIDDRQCNRPVKISIFRRRKRF